jgi:hypothetical protein
MSIHLEKTIKDVEGLLGARNRGPGWRARFGTHCRIKKNLARLFYVTGLDATGVMVVNWSPSGDDMGVVRAGDQGEAFGKEEKEVAALALWGICLYNVK